MVIKYAGYTRVQNGKLQIISACRHWTADDYDLIEELIAQGLRYHEMLPYFTDPPVSLDALKSACYEAGIEYPYKAGRPRKRIDHVS